MKQIVAIASMLLAFSTTLSAAETVRQLGPHKHGRGTLDLAVEGQTVQMSLEVPGSDIVGFEYEAKTAEDQAKIEAAKETLSQPWALFTLPHAAGCKVTSTKVHVAGASESDKSADEHAANSEEHEAEHFEFHVQYALSCANVAAIKILSFPYFDAFPNSEELKVTLITERGQKAFEVNRDHALINIQGMM